MAFNFFGKNKEEEIDNSVKKYKKFLHNNLDLGMCIMYDKEAYYPEIEKLENRDIIFRLTGKSKSTLKYKVGQVIQIEFVNAKNALYFTTIKIVDKAMDNDNVYYKGNIVSPIEKKQRRDNYRLSTNIKVTFSLLPEKLRSYSGIAKDISCGGMKMESDQFISKGKKVHLLFEIEKHKYNVNALITGNAYDEFNEKNIHHIKFEGMNHKDKKILNNYIFEEQKRRIKSGYGNV